MSEYIHCGRAPLNSPRAVNQTTRTFMTTPPRRNLRRVPPPPVNTRARRRTHSSSSTSSSTARRTRVPARRARAEPRGGVVAVDRVAVRDRVPQLLSHDRRGRVGGQLDGEEARVRHGQVPAQRRINEQTPRAAAAAAAAAALRHRRRAHRSGGARPNAWMVNRRVNSLSVSGRRERPHTKRRNPARSSCVNARSTPQSSCTWRSSREQPEYSATLNMSSTSTWVTRTRHT